MFAGKIDGKDRSTAAENQPPVRDEGTMAPCPIGKSLASIQSSPQAGRSVVVDPNPVDGDHSSMPPKTFYLRELIQTRRDIGEECCQAEIPG